MGIFRLALALVFIAYAAVANAVTLDTATAVVGGPTISNSGIGPLQPVLTASAAGVTYFGDFATVTTTTGVTPPPATPLLITANFGVLPNTFTFDAVTIGFPPVPPTNLLLGSFVESASTTSSITALFSTTGGTFASDFGSFFRVTITDTTPIPVDVLTSPFPFFGTAPTLLVEAVVEAPAPIPLPAGGILLLTGLGGLAAMRRKMRKAQG